MRIAVFAVLGVLFSVIYFRESDVLFYQFYEEFLRNFGYFVTRPKIWLSPTWFILSSAILISFIAPTFFNFRSWRNTFICVISGIVCIYLFPIFRLIPFTSTEMQNSYQYLPSGLNIRYFNLEYFALVGLIFGTFISAYFLKRTERKRFPDKSNDELLDVD